MIVNEVFTSIEGEGIRAGKVCTFIRFTGCNLRCEWCDTRYSFSEGEEMSVSEILSKVPSDARYVTITGGEPLLQPKEDLDALVLELISKGIEVNFETNGSVDFTPYLKDGIMITADYKLPSSKMSDRMNLDSLSKLREKDVLKFVIGDENDLSEAERVVKLIKPVCHVYLSTVFGGIELSKVADWLKQSDVKDSFDIRIQVQLHKIIWSHDTRGV